MPESRSKYSRSAAERRRGNIRNILLGLLIGSAVLFVILAGRYVYGKSKDPDFRIRDMFGHSTAYSGTLPALPTLPIDSLLADLSSLETAGSGSSESESASTPSASDASEAVSTPEETTTEAAPSPDETTTAADTTDSKDPSAESESTPAATVADTTTTAAETPGETTEVITDPSDIRYHLKRGSIEESDLGKCQQLIVAKSSGTQCTLYFFEKGKDGWAQAEAVPSAPGVLGRNGVTTAKHEGDGSTPAGFYGLGPCYGEDETPATAMKYQQIKKGDYWVDDASSKYYNTFVHEDNYAGRKGWQTGENLFDLLRYYRYMVVIQYNTDPIVPGAGSAIFLHCQAGDPDTSGCVSTKEATMFAIFRWLDPKADPHILIY